MCIFIIYTEYSRGMIAGVDPDPTCRGRVHLRLAHYKGPGVEKCKKRWADESDESMWDIEAMKSISWFCHLWVISVEKVALDLIELQFPGMKYP